VRRLRRLSVPFGGVAVIVKGKFTGPNEIISLNPNKKVGWVSKYSEILIWPCLQNKSGDFRLILNPSSLEFSKLNIYF
jgi:hypothetical protein